MKLIASITLVCFLHMTSTQISGQNRIGIFDNHKDIGKPALSGSASFDAATQTYTIKGAGYNIWFNRDEFQYLYKTIKGDFILTANFQFVGKGTNMHRKIGWMVRESDGAEAAHMSATNHGDGLATLQWRTTRGAYMRDPEDEIFAVKPNPQIIQLERMGKKFLMRIANVGEPLQLVGIQELPFMKDSVLAGIFICSHDSAVVDEAKVWNVRIDRPVPNTGAAERAGGVGVRLETMNVFTGVRKVVRESNTKFEAPNWMPDGKFLLFNQNGALYKIPVDGGDTIRINTGEANRNNNDHGISFDGKMLAISSHRPGLPGGGSTVYVLPLAGGAPKLLTEKTPSYWHGWNPNGKEVVYVGMRDGKNYDIYKIPVTGGQEIKLTSNNGYHVDGPEYSPDGKYIYYNGSQSGTMQIWRMHPDGTHHEQLTFDEYNNWFPHISPDGKWMVMISFPPDINPKDHPSYKRVMIRLMPVAGGAPKVIAYLYGGQGTINVPSWSPDSKSIAFVSNSEKPE